MAGVIFYTPAHPGTKGTPEVKIEGVPYQSAVPGRPEFPGVVCLELTVEEAKALQAIMGQFSTEGGIKHTASIYYALKPAVGCASEVAMGYALRAGYIHPTDSNYPPTVYLVKTK